MSVWKSFCRKIESKAVRRHFGDLVPLINTSAVFEFSDEQIKNARAYEGDREDLPPFPFPRMCFVGSGGVISMRDPTMDDAGHLIYTVTVITSGGLFGTTTVDVRPDGSLAVLPCRGLRPNGLYFDRSAEVPDPTFESESERWESKLAEHRNPQGGRQLLDELIEAERDAHAASVEVANATRNQLDSIQNLLTAQFASGLAQVRWINKPDHYTVEVGSASPPRKTKKTKRPRVTRLAERPRHIVLTKSEIETEWRRVHAGGTHASPIPHLRRGHYRTLKPRGTKDSRRVWVRAAHINGSCVEWRDGDVRYRVV